MSETAITPRVREFSRLEVRTRAGSENEKMNFADATVTFWPDGWAEVVGTALNENGIAMGTSTFEYSVHQSVFMHGTEAYSARTIS